MKVLVVDDSLTVRMDLTDVFRDAGFSPTPCATLNDARTALAAGPVDLIVLDVLLPDGDGVDFVRELKGYRGNPPIMLLSSEAAVADRIRGLKTGADDYVGKPYDKSYLIARARELIRRTAAHRAESDKALILLIDDSATFREEIRTALEGAGYEVKTCSDGESGLLSAVDLRPSAIVVDGVLPGIDGATVIRRVRGDAALRGTPCILLTASKEAVGEVVALEAGADAYVRKEDDARVVLARLAALLRSSQASTRRQNAASLLTPKKVLAVDDSVTYLNEIGDKLRQHGYDVALASSGEEAMQLLAIEPVDCILLDMVMPGLSGEETCRRIKATPGWRETPLIMHTSRDDRLAMLECINAGADDYIPKAAEIEVLLARLQAQLRRKQFEDESRQISEELQQKELETAESRSAKALAETRAQLLADLQQKNIELQRAKVDLEATNQRIVEATRMKSEFLANMSHELRTPLNAIIGFSELMHESTSDDALTRHEYLGAILSSGRHLLGLINDVLDLSKVEAGKMEFHPEHAELSALVNEGVAVLRELAAKKHLRVEVASARQDVVLDVSRFKQVLYNFLSNAIKFTPDHGLVRVRTLAEGPFFRLEVEDTGEGIEPENIKRLFVEFQQLDSGLQKHHGGTGLGLALTKKIVEAQGGQVGVRSQVKKGSTFFALLPRASAHEVVAAAKNERVKEPTSAGQGQTVLVIDDNAINLRLVQAMLPGYRVITASSAEQGLVELKAHHPRVVLMDLQLPGTDGLTLTRMIKRDASYAGTAIIAVTAHAMKGDEENALAAGCDAYLAKPINRRTLLSLLERFFA